MQKTQFAFQPLHRRGGTVLMRLQQTFKGIVIHSAGAGQVGIEFMIEGGGIHGRRCHPEQFTTGTYPNAGGPPGHPGRPTADTGNQALAGNGSVRNPTDTSSPAKINTRPLMANTPGTPLTLNTAPPAAAPNAMAN